MWVGQQFSGFGDVGVAQCRRLDAAPAPPDVQHQHQQGNCQQRKRPQPQQYGGGFKRWTVQHKVAVTLDHEIQNLLLRLALRELDADLVFQVNRQIGMRRGYGFVLADETPQLFGNHHHAGLKGRVCRCVGRDFGLGIEA